jgi:integrase
MYQRNGSWSSDFWYQGQRFTKSHGPVNKTVAKEKDRKFRSEVASGSYQKQKNDLPFDKAVLDHLKRSHQNNASSSYRRNQSIAEHLEGHYKKRKISTIENNEILIRKYVKKRKGEITEKQTKQGRAKEELTFTTINRELAFLRSMFNALIKAGKANKNPVSLVQFFEEIQKERVLTVDEVERILKAIDESDIRYQHLKDIVKIGLNTAMRQGEILKMKKSWIDLKGILFNPPGGFIAKRYE